MPLKIRFRHTSTVLLLHRGPRGGGVSESAFEDQNLKPPAFQFYPDDFLGGTLHFTDAEVGLYIRLLSVQWSAGSLPDDDAELASYGKGGTPVHRVREKFQKGSDGRLRNERLEVERRKQAEFRDKQAENGRKGGRPARKGLGLSGLSQTKAKKSFPSPSPSPSPSSLSDPVSVTNGEGKASRSLAFKPPNIEEVKLQAAKTGMPETEAFKFHAHFESNGWRVGSNPMRSWHAALQKWHLNGPRYGGRQQPAQPTQNLPIRDL